MKRLFLFLLLVLPLSLHAHPHIFVDTGFRLIVDDAGVPTGVEISWGYDELYSLLVLEDMELDDDYDGILTEAELARLSGFDLKWVEGFEGDFFVYANGAKLKLGPPENRGASFQNGQIISRHYRTIEGAGRSVQIKAFDFTYYTQYDLNREISLPEGCDVQIIKADVEAANAMVRAELGDDMDRLADDPNADWPAVGEAYADEVRITCAAGS